MPNYKFHTAANLILGTPIIYYGLFHQNSTDHELVAVAGAAFVVGTLLLSPDLDLKHSRITKNWGVLGLFWRGYSKSFKHRGLSHSLFFSTLTRVTYLLMVAAVLFFSVHLIADLTGGNGFKNAYASTYDWFSRVSGEGYSKIIVNRSYFIAAAIGVVLSDWIHILFDRFLSAFKSRLS